MSRNMKLRKRNRNHFRASLMGALMVLLTLIVIFVIGINTTVRSQAASDRENSVRCYKSIEVKPGDSLWSIADEYADDFGCSTKEYAEEIRRVNGLKSDYLKSGSKILVVYRSES